MPRRSSRSLLFRVACIAVVLACAGLLGYAYWLQFREFLDPCPLCIFQRLAFAALGAIALVGALHNPPRLWPQSLCLARCCGGADWCRHRCAPRVDTVATAGPHPRVWPGPRFHAGQSATRPGTAKSADWLRRVCGRGLEFHGSFDAVVDAAVVPGTRRTAFGYRLSAQPLTPSTRQGRRTIISISTKASRASPVTPTQVLAGSRSGWK